MKKVRETNESLNKGGDTFCLGECVLEGRFRFRGEILNMPQRELRSGAAFRMTLMLLIAPFVFGEMGEAAAQCVATADCASLGYTEASCSNGGLKCPFGTTWSCKGDGTTAKANCEVGWILYSDKTCSSTENRDITKTPIGVVFYKNPNGGGIALALKDFSTYKYAPAKCQFYGPPGITTSAPDDDYQLTEDDCLEQHYSKDFTTIIKEEKADALQDFNSCKNTKILKENGYYISDVTEYTTDGTKAGDWCIPAAGVLEFILHQEEAINITLTNMGYKKLKSDPVRDSYVSSTVALYGLIGMGDNGGAPEWDFRTWRGRYSSIDNSNINVFNEYLRPVIEF